MGRAAVGAQTPAPPEGKIWTGVYEPAQAEQVRSPSRPVLAVPRKRSERRPGGWRLRSASLTVGATPQMMAAGLNRRDIGSLGTDEESLQAIRTFMARGLDVNAFNDDGQTAVHGAAQRGVSQPLRC